MRIIVTAIIGSILGRLILKRTGGPEGVEKMMVEVMPKVMDKAFDQLAPAKRREMLAHLHTTLDALDQKYGTGTEHAADPTE